MSIKVGIIGVTGYGGGEALRICAAHPEFEVVYVAGESSAGQKLSARYPGLVGKLGEMVIEKFDPAHGERVDVLFASLPTGESKAPLAAVSSATKIVDIGGDHRYQAGWVYGLADVWPGKIKAATRVANPGCYPSAALAAIVPLIDAGLVDLHPPVIIDAKSGVSGAGRGGGDSKFGYAEVNEDVAAYGLLKHPHVAEIRATIETVATASKHAGYTGKSESDEEVRVAFTPHLIPMTRGILATCYLCPKEGAGVSTEKCLEVARKFYAGRPFVRVVEKPPHTKWATGSNLVFVSYAQDGGRGPIIALGAIDNLGKGAAGQAVQNANLMCGLEETMGLEGLTVWP